MEFIKMCFHWRRNWCMIKKVLPSQFILRTHTIFLRKLIKMNWGNQYLFWSFNQNSSSFFPAWNVWQLENKGKNCILLAITPHKINFITGATVQPRFSGWTAYNCEQVCEKMNIALWWLPLLHTYKTFFPYKMRSYC